MPSIIVFAKTIAVRHLREPNRWESSRCSAPTELPDKSITALDAQFDYPKTWSSRNLCVRERLRWKAIKERVLRRGFSPTSRIHCSVAVGTVAWEHNLPGIPRLKKLPGPKESRMSEATASRSHILVPAEFPIPRGRDAWLVVADWWYEQGDEAKSNLCRRIANSLPG